MKQVLPPGKVPPAAALAEKICTVPDVFYGHELSLVDELLRKPVLAGRGERIALLDGDRRMTYAEIDRLTNRWANGLRRLGVRSGDRVLVRMPNIPEFIFAQFALWKLNAIVVPIMIQVRASEIAHRITDVGATFAIADEERMAAIVEGAKLAGVSLRARVVVTGETGGTETHIADVIASASDVCEIEPYDSDDIAMLLFTSGTTGPSKPVIKSHHSLIALADTYAKYLLDLRPDDVSGGTPALAFAYGAFNFATFPFRFGAALSLFRGEGGAEAMWSLIEKHRISVFQSVPLFFRNMLDVPDVAKRWDISSLRIAETASGPVTAALLEQWRTLTGTDVINSLGSSELNYTLSTVPNRRPATQQGMFAATGFPVHGTMCKLLDDDGKPVAAGTIGELFVKQPWAIEYWGNADKQRDVVYEGWNRPGLMFSADAEGCFWYASRTDDMIVTSGFNVSCDAVEAYLAEHAAVADCAVVGAPPPPDRIEVHEVVKALVVLRPGFAATNELRADILTSTAERCSAAYMRPRDLEFVQALPRTTTGKLQRALMKKDLWARTSLIPSDPQLQQTT